jgi:putative protein-disulfide isomerase
MKNHILYFADPMCSWCWGFAPVIKILKQEYAQQFPLYLFLGGLGRDTRDALDVKSKRSIREHWEHVHTQTQQPFNFEFFEWDGFIYNTELACRAVVTARRIKTEQALDFLIHLHHAFYTRLKDITDTNILFEMAEEFGFNKTEFKTEFESSAVQQETETDFDATRKMGVTGYPTLYIGNMDQGYSVITAGYHSWEKIEGSIAEWVESASN